MIVHVDELGRFVIPAPVREALGWGPGTAVEFGFQEDGALVVRASRTRCRLCGGVGGLPGGRAVWMQWVCAACVQGMRAGASA